jgi:hypothetical protein
MQIVIDIPDRLIDNEFGYTDIRLHKDTNHINSITTQDYESPYFAYLSFVVLPEHHGRLIDYGYIVDAIDDWVNAEEYRYTNATDYLRKRVEKTPTAIEADKEEE